jgi:hypothetical protein
MQLTVATVILTLENNDKKAALAVTNYLILYSGDNFKD